MKTIATIYYSPTHTSRSIARAVTKGLEGHQYEEYDLTVHEKTIELRDTICIIAAPVYGGLLAPIARKRIQQIKAKNCLAIPIVVYGNRDYEDALVELADLLTDNGFTILCAGAFIGEHSYSRPNMPIAAGRPDKRDLEQALLFGHEARKKYNNLGLCHLTNQSSIFPSLPPMNIKGNRPYKTLSAPTPQAPVVKDTCNGCGICCTLCPTQAISLSNSISSTDIDRCTKCCACVKFCPSQARIFDTPYTTRLHQNCQARREPEWFI